MLFLRFRLLQPDMRRISITYSFDSLFEILEYAELPLAQYHCLTFNSLFERFFRYLKKRAEGFYNNINTWKNQSIEDYAKTIAIIRNLHTTIKTQGGVLPS